MGAVLTGRRSKPRLRARRYLQSRRIRRRLSVGAPRRYQNDSDGFNGRIHVVRSFRSNAPSDCKSRPERSSGSLSCFAGVRRSRDRVPRAGESSAASMASGDPLTSADRSTQASQASTPERLRNRRQLRRVGVPRSTDSAIDRLAHLVDARRAGGGGCGGKREAGRCPCRPRNAIIRRASLSRSSTTASYSTLRCVVGRIVCE